MTEDGRRTRVFSSADGEAITANGWYDNETGEIWIDVNAGVDGNGLILFTAAHELTHFIKDWSSEKYNAFANFLISQYAENGVSVDELIEEQIEKAAKRGREMTREEAFDEVVADSCESFLTDSNAAEKISALNEKDATLAEKIKSYIHKLLVKIRNLLKGIDPDSEEGKIVRGMTDSLEQLYELWTDALEDAGKSYSKAGVVLDTNSESVAPQFFERDSNVSETVIELTADSELVERIENSNRSKYSVIRDYLVEKFYGQTFTLSDGIEAVMDKRDSQELSHLADSRKTAALSNLRDIIEKARFSHQADEVKHNKFDAFRYYSVKVSFNGQIYDILLNVGHSKYKDEYHIYDITNKKRTANQSSTGLSQPVGYAMKSSSSNTIISQPSENVNSKSKKFSERTWSASEYVTERDAAARKLAERYDDYDKPITVEDIEVLRSIGRKSVNKFTAEDIKKAQKWAYKFNKELGVKSPFFRAWFGDWRAKDQKQIKIVSVPTIDISQVSLVNGNYVVKDTGWNVYAGKTLNDDTRHHSGGNRINVKALNAIEAILDNAVLLDTIVSEKDTKKKSENTAFLHKLYTIIQYNNRKYIAITTVEEYYNETINDISRRAYNLKAIKIEPVGGQLGENSSSSIPDTSSMISISDLYEFVKSFDKDFSPALEVNEKMLSEDGTPKIFYHGTKSTFTAFDRKKAKSSGLYGRGFYFTDSKSHSTAYGDAMAVYLNIRKPLSPASDTVTKEQIRNFLSAVAENEDYSIENYGTYDVDEVLNGITSRDAFRGDIRHVIGFIRHNGTTTASEQYV